MKILLAITELGAGGAEKIIAILSEKLIRFGHSVSVVSLQKRPEEDAIPVQLEACGAKVIYLDLGKRQLNMLARIRQVVASEAPDIVHTHLIHPNLLFRIAMIGMKIPLVNTIHISERRKGKKIFFLLDRLTFSLADAVTAVSDASALFHEHASHLRFGQIIRTIRNGSDPVVPASPERIQEVSNLWHLNNYPVILGSIGRLDWQKGYDLLLKKCDALSKRIPVNEKWLLLILGEGPERKKLEAVIAEKSYSKLDILLPGFQKDAASLMTCFNVFLMPSRYEGYGLALAEAMSLGLPVVCTDVDSLPELCQQYEGFSQMVHLKHGEDFDDEDWANAVEAALANGTKAKGQTLFTTDAMAEKYLALYKEVIQRRSLAR